MIKWILAFALAIFNLNSFAEDCSRALPPHAREFCGTFEKSAQCYCRKKSKGLPNVKCDTMENIYDKMISTFHSLERACDFQKDVSSQECVDSWNCYRKGGSTSYGRYCNDTATKPNDPDPSGNYSNSCLNLPR